MPIAAFSLLIAAALLTGCTSDDAAAESSVSAAPATSQSQPDPTTAPAIPELKRHLVADGTLSFESPVEWTLQDQPLESHQTPGPTTVNIEVRDATGKTVASLSTGMGAVLHYEYVPDAPMLPYKIRDQEKTSLEHSLAETHSPNTFMLETLGKGAEIQGSVALGMPLAEPKDSLQYLAPSAVNGAEGLYFGHFIEPTDALTDVDKALTGDAKFTAYMKTTQYQDLKAMLVSLRQLAPKAGLAAPANTEPVQCLGASYSYDLKDSGMSCTEAKGFVQKIHDEGGGGAGGFELVGHGGCYTMDEDGAYVEQDDLICTVETTGKKFGITMRN